RSRASESARASCRFTPALSKAIWFRTLPRSRAASVFSRSISALPDDMAKFRFAVAFRWDAPKRPPSRFRPAPIPPRTVGVKNMSRAEHVDFGNHRQHVGGKRGVAPEREVDVLLVPSEVVHFHHAGEERRRLAE